MGDQNNENIDQLSDEPSGFVTAFIPREDLICLMISLDFTREAAIKALYHTGNNDADRAAGWLLENCNDPHLNEPLNFQDLYETDDDDDDDFMSPDSMFKMVFVVNCELNMGVGKIAAQVGHAAIGVYRILLDECQEFLYLWEKIGEKKIVLKGENREQLDALSTKATSLNLPNLIVHDAGHTQVESGSTTVLGLFGQVDKVNDVTGHLKLL